MNNLIKVAKNLPISQPTPAISLSSVKLNVPGRELPLDARVTAPSTGTNLPIILLSHGHGPSNYISSKDGYAPLRDFYAEQGFIVIQPTHVNSKVAGLSPAAPGGPLFWQSRAKDMKSIVEQLDQIEVLAPFIKGRMDKSCLAAVGHSLGSQTVSLLLGAKAYEGSQMIDLSESRIKAGVLLGPPGEGGDALTAKARDEYHFPNTDFSTMTTPTLVVYGDQDATTHLTTRGAKWHTDPYYKSKGEKSLLTLHGAGHGCGGVAAYDAKETDDEDPERLAIVQRMTCAYLKSKLDPSSSAWEESCAALKDHCADHASVENHM